MILEAYWVLDYLHPLQHIKIAPEDLIEELSVSKALNTASERREPIMPEESSDHEDNSSHTQTIVGGIGAKQKTKASTHSQGGVGGSRDEDYTFPHPQTIVDDIGALQDWVTRRYSRGDQHLRAQVHEELRGQIISVCFILFY